MRNISGNPVPVLKYSTQYSCTHDLGRLQLVLSPAPAHQLIMESVGSLRMRLTEHSELSDYVASYSYHITPWYTVIDVNVLGLVVPSV